MDTRERNANGTFKPGGKLPENARRAKGVANKLTADIRRDCIAGFAAHGLDGKGKNGFRGYVQFLATKHPKAACRLIEKILPFVVNGNGLGHSAISTVNIVSVPSGSFLSREAMDRLQREPQLIEHTSTIEQTEPERFEEPAAIVPEIETQSDDAQLAAELNAMSIEQLMVRAGVTDVDQS